MRTAKWIVLGMAAALAACGEEPKKAEAPPPAPQRPRDRLSYQEMTPSPPSKYPLKTCVITGKELATLGHKPYAISYKGYEMQFCSEDCLDGFAADPEGNVRKMNPKAMFDHSK